MSTQDNQAVAELIAKRERAAYLRGLFRGVGICGAVAVVFILWLRA